MSAAEDDVKKTALDAINRHFLLSHPAQAADLIDGFGKSAAIELLSEQQPDALAARLAASLARSNRRDRARDTREAAEAVSASRSTPRCSRCRCRGSPTTRASAA